ncbi:glycosyltransferase 87 family protein [Paenibacillus sp. GYB004]|uniref:glycosyltransferase 87 family protein n=1 Tax=Paenibacillus sp. GYB004 TaxID=2994393 RepID=UPI002F967766
MIRKFKDLERLFITTLLERKWNILVILFSSIIGFLIQLAGIKNMFVSGDWIFHYSLWYQELKENGGLLALGIKIGDYPSGFNLLLACMTYLPFAPMMNFKLLIIVFYFIAAIAAYHITKNINKNSAQKKQYASVAYAVVLLLPSLLLNTTIWGQVDSIWVGILLIAIYFITKEKYGLSFLMIGVALSIKQTTILIFPMLLLLYIRNNKISILHFFNILIGFIAMCLPAIVMGKSIKDVFAPYLGYRNDDITSMVVTNFSNIYALFTPDPVWSKWVTNELFSSIGMWFCIFVIGIIALVMHYKKVDISGNNFLLAATMFIVLLCNFLPGVHDRYMILADVLSIIYVISSRRLKDIWIPAYVNFVSAFNIINYLHGVSESVSNTRIILVQIVSILFLALSIYLVYHVVFTLVNCCKQQLTSVKTE